MAECAGGCAKCRLGDCLRSGGYRFVLGECHKPECGQNRSESCSKYCSKHHLECPVVYGVSPLYADQRKG